MDTAVREPDFDNILRVLQRKEPNRPTLFEFYLDNEISERLTGQKAKSLWDCSWNYEMIIPAMKKVGYDYATMHASDFGFPVVRPQGRTVSMSHGVITDEESFQDIRFSIRTLATRVVWRRSKRCYRRE